MSVQFNPGEKGDMLEISDLSKYEDNNVQVIEVTLKSLP